MKQQLINWWSSLQQREQRLVTGAAVVIVIGVLYWLVWQPLHQSKHTQQQRLDAAQRQYEQLQQLLPQLAGTSGVVSRNGSLSQVISTSARGNAISVSRMQPQNDQLTLVLEDVSFEQLLTWLHALQYQHGVTLVSLDVATLDKPGMVRVRRMVVE